MNSHHHAGLYMGLAVITASFFVGGCQTTPPRTVTEAPEPVKTVSAAKPANAQPEAAEAPEAADRTPKPIPASLVDTGEFGENIYDAAKAGKWEVVTAKLADLKKAAAQLPKDIPTPSGAQTRAATRLTTALAALDTAVAAKEKQATMAQSNQVTLAAAQLTTPFNPPIPVSITRLDYLGRELEIWSAVNDLAKLQTTAANITRTWTRLHPQVDAKGANAAQEAKKFDDIVAKVGTAKTAADYHAAATPLLDEVDVLEKIFTQ